VFPTDVRIRLWSHGDMLPAGRRSEGQRPNFRAWRAQPPRLADLPHVYDSAGDRDADAAANRRRPCAVVAVAPSAGRRRARRGVHQAPGKPQHCREPRFAASRLRPIAVTCMSMASDSPSCGIPRSTRTFCSRCPNGILRLTPRGLSSSTDLCAARPNVRGPRTSGRSRYLIFASRSTSSILAVSCSSRVDHR
jgi:hypothetical protein